MEDRILQLELSMERAQRDINELMEIVKDLSYMVNDMQTQINYLIDKQPKSL